MAACGWFTVVFSIVILACEGTGLREEKARRGVKYVRHVHDPRAWKLTAPLAGQLPHCRRPTGGIQIIHVHRPQLEAFTKCTRETQFGRCYRLAPRSKVATKYPVSERQMITRSYSCLHSSRQGPEAYYPLPQHNIRYTTFLLFYSTHIISRLHLYLRS